LQKVEEIGAPAEDGRNRNSCRRWKEYELLQKVEGTPSEGVRNRSCGRRLKE
jgi:hypothetical protein